MDVAIAVVPWASPCLPWHGLFRVLPGANPEKWMGRWLKWRTKDVQRNFWLIKYSLGHVNCFVSIHVLLQLSHHHEENEASYAVWLNMLIIVCLSDWFASHHTLCLQEWFVQVNQRRLKHGDGTPKGGRVATQFTPPGSAPDWCCQNSTLKLAGLLYIIVCPIINFKGIELL